MRIGLATSSVFALALSSALLLIPSISSAGPWVDAEPGHGYVSLGWSNYSADTYLAGPCSGGCDPTNVFQKTQKYGSKQPITIPFKNPGEFTGNLSSNYINNSAQLYGEVSLWKHLGFVASMPLVQGISQQEEQNHSLSTTHAGDLIFGLKYQIPLSAAYKGLAFGPQVYITAPTGDVNARGQYANADLQSANQPLPLPTGNGTWDIETRMSAGYAFYPIPIFVIGEVGYHHHWDNATCTGIPDPNHTGITKQSVTYSDDVPWTVQVGGTYEPVKKRSWFHHVTVIGSVHGTKSLENGFIDKTGEAAYLRPCGQSNNATYLSAGGQIMIFPIKWFGLTYSIEHVLIGGNVGFGLTSTFGLAAQF
jgi:hypothetical protein